MLKKTIPLLILLLTPIFVSATTIELIPNNITNPLCSFTIAENLTAAQPTTWPFAVPCTAGTLAEYNQTNTSNDVRATNSGGSTSLDAGYYVNFTLPPNQGIYWINITGEIQAATTTDNGTLAFYNTSSGLKENIAWTTPNLPAADRSIGKNVSTLLTNYYNTNNKIQVILRTWGGNNVDPQVDYIGILIMFNATVNTSGTTKNDSELYESDSGNFSTIASAPSGTLSHAIFSWNASGASCDTWANTSTTTTSGEHNMVNFTQTIPVGCVGKVIGWQIHVNNTDSKWNLTALQTFTVATPAASRLNWSTITKNDTVILDGDDINYSVSWSAPDDGLSYAIFSWNASGAGCDTWANDTPQALNGQHNHVSFEKTMPAACAGKTIGWQIHANTTVNAKNLTSLQSHIVNARPIMNLKNYSQSNYAFDDDYKDKTTRHADLTVGGNIALNNTQYFLGNSSATWRGSGAAPYASVPSNVSIAQNTSLSFWIYKDFYTGPAGHEQYVVNDWAGSNFNLLFTIYVANGSIRICNGNGATADCRVSNQTIGENSWNHVLFSRNYTNVKLWINATLVMDWTSAYQGYDTVNLIKIGAEQTPTLTYAMNATLDDTTFFNRSMNQNDANALYMYGEGIMYPYWEYPQAADSCTYGGSGDWTITCSDNCNLNTNTNLGGNDITTTGTGTITITASITNFITVKNHGTSCKIRVGSGGRLTA